MEQNAPQFTPAQPAPVQTGAPAPARRDSKLVWGLVCLIGPTALIVISILLYALVSFVTASTASPQASGELFNQPPVGVTIANVVLFIIGALSVITWLPGVIVGIILLATRKK